MQRRNRLGSESLIRRVYATGARVRLKGATVTGIVDGIEPPRIAVVASRRVGGAVVRNRARRRLRAVIDSQMTLIQEGTVAVIAATPDTPNISFQQLEDSVRRGIQKAGLVRAAGA